MARNVETKNNTNISTKSSPVPNGRGRKQPLAMTNKVTKGPNNNRQNPVMNNRRINPRRNNANKQQQQNVKNTNNKQQDTTTKTEKRTRVDRRLKQKGVEGGVELDEAERARRAKRAARFNLKQ
nr:hypothetical protein [Babesia bovis]